MNGYKPPGINPRNLEEVELANRIAEAHDKRFVKDVDDVLIAASEANPASIDQVVDAMVHGKPLTYVRVKDADGPLAQRADVVIGALRDLSHDERAQVIVDAALEIPELKRGADRLTTPAREDIEYLEREGKTAEAKLAAEAEREFQEAKVDWVDE